MPDFPYTGHESFRTLGKRLKSRTLLERGYCKTAPVARSQGEVAIAKFGRPFFTVWVDSKLREPLYRLTDDADAFGDFILRRM